MAVATHQVKPLQLWAGRIGHGFLCLATIVCSLAGWTFGGGWSNPAMGVVLGAIFGLCPWAVAYLLPFASIAAQSGRRGLATVMMVGVVIAGAMELRGEIMVFAGKRAASSTEATLQKTRWEDARNAVNDLEKQLKVAQAKLEEQAPYGPAASYDARIRDAEDLAAREASSARKGCLKKCDEAKKVAADLRAKQAIANDREQKTEPEVARLTKELAEARQIASTTKAGDSMSVAEAETLAALWTASLNPSADAKRWTDIWAGLFMAVFLLVVPTTLIYASKMDWSAERPKRQRSRLFSSIAAWLKGEKPEPVARETVSHPATIPPIEQRFAPPPTRHVIDAITVADILRLPKAA